MFSLALFLRARGREALLQAQASVYTSSAVVGRWFCGLYSNIRFNAAHHWF